MDMDMDQKCIKGHSCSYKRKRTGTLVFFAFVTFQILVVGLINMYADIDVIRFTLTVIPSILIFDVTFFWLIHKRILFCNQCDDLVPID